MRNETVKIEEIKNIIERLYEDLHRKHDLDGLKQNKYIKDNNNIKLNKERITELESNITKNLLKEAIDKQKRSKAPGPDLYQLNYIKTGGGPNNSL